MILVVGRAENVPFGDAKKVLFALSTFKKLPSLDLAKPGDW